MLRGCGSGASCLAEPPKDQWGPVAREPQRALPRESCVTADIHRCPVSQLSPLEG